MTPATLMRWKKRYLDPSSCPLSIFRAVIQVYNVMSEQQTTANNSSFSAWVRSLFSIAIDTFPNLPGRMIVIERLERFRYRDFGPLLCHNHNRVCSVGLKILCYSNVFRHISGQSNVPCLTVWIVAETEKGNSHYISNYLEIARLYLIFPAFIEPVNFIRERARATTRESFLGSAR